jgi:hypothetical protein
MMNLIEICKLLCGMKHADGRPEMTYFMQRICSVSLLLASKRQLIISSMKTSKARNYSYSCNYMAWMVTVNLTCFDVRKQSSGVVSELSCGRYHTDVAIL